MLTLVRRDNLTDACVDATKLDCVTVQVHLWLLDLAKQLEEERLRVSHQDFKVLLDGLLVNALCSDGDCFLLVWSQVVVRDVKVDDVAAASVDGFADNKASTLQAVTWLVLGDLLKRHEVFDIQLLVL